MRPDAELAGLLGLGSDAGDLANGYLQVAAGRGITGETMQFHDTADRWTVGGRHDRRDAVLDADAATSNPAVTLRSVGAPAAGRRVHLRPRALGRLHAPGQPGLGGPGARRRGRADPLGRPLLRRRAEPDWVDLDKVAIPQADEQQRLLANLSRR